MDRLNSLIQLNQNGWSHLYEIMGEIELKNEQIRLGKVTVVEYWNMTNPPQPVKLVTDFF